MIVRKLADNTIIKINVDANEEEFIRKNTTSGFFLVDSLPFSRHNFWRVKDKSLPLSENNIIADETKNIMGDIELKQEEYASQISSMLKDKAKELGFQSFYTASAYLTQADNPLKLKAEKLGVWGGRVWGKSMKIQIQVQNGTIPMPETWEELKDMLPKWED